MKYFLAVLFLFGVPFQSRGDAMADFYQADCAFRYGYFSFRTLVVNDLDNGDNRKPYASLQRPFKLNNPYMCNLPKNVINEEPRIITVRLQSYRPQREYGKCSAREQYHIVVQVNGKDIYTFDPFKFDESVGDRCDSQGTHHIEITPWSARDCVLPDQDLQGDKEPYCLKINM